MSVETKTIRLFVKDPDELWELGGDDETRKRFLEFGEYATIELTVTEDFTIVSARFVPRDEWSR